MKQRLQYQFDKLKRIIQYKRPSTSNTNEEKLADNDLLSSLTVVQPIKLVSGASGIQCKKHNENLLSNKISNTLNSTRRNSFSSDAYNMHNTGTFDFEKGDLYKIFCDMIREKNISGVFRILKSLTEEKYLYKLGKIYLEETAYDTNTCHNYLQYFCGKFFLLLFFI